MCPLPSTFFLCPQASGSLLPRAQEVQHAARKYLDQHAWDVYYKGAYIKLVTSFATWSPAAGSKPYTIYGNECASGTVVDPTCAQDAPGPMGHEAATLWNKCQNCTTGASRVAGAWCYSLRWRSVPLVLMESSGSHAAHLSRCQPLPVPLGLLPQTAALTTPAASAFRTPPSATNVSSAYLHRIPLTTLVLQTSSTTTVVDRSSVLCPPRPVTELLQPGCPAAPATL